MVFKLGSGTLDLRGGILGSRTMGVSQGPSKTKPNPGIVGFGLDLDVAKPLKDQTNPGIMGLVWIWTLPNPGFLASLVLELCGGILGDAFLDFLGSGPA